MIKVINSNAEYWAQEGYDLQSIYNHIAKCARICYQSVAKDGELPYEFLKRVILRGKDIYEIDSSDLDKLHLSVFEHGTVHLRININCVPGDLIAKQLMKNQFTRYTIINEGDDICYITTNMRVIIENGIWAFEQYIDNDKSHVGNYLERLTMCLTTDIGCSRELNRHRCHSVSEESSRYCRYTANKFGNNISILKLPWIDYSPKEELVDTAYENGFYNDNEIYDEKTHLIEARNTNNWNAIDWFFYGVQIANLVYAKCIEHGWKAEQAREILPLNTKTQLVHTAFETDWEHFISLRANEVSGKVHPVMKDLAERIKDCLSVGY